MPEVSKAFAFRATRFEGFTIACYDAATGGFSAPTVTTRALPPRTAVLP